MADLAKSSKPLFTKKRLQLEICDIWQHPEYAGQDALTRSGFTSTLEKLQGRSIPKFKEAGYCYDSDPVTGYYQALIA